LWANDWIHMRHTWHTRHMSWGRVVSSCLASVAVGGCAVVAIGMSQAASKPSASRSTTSVAVPTARPAVLAPVDDATPSAPVVTSPAPRVRTTHAPARPTTSAVVAPTTSRPAVTTSAARRVAGPVAVATTHRVVSHPAPRPVAKPATRTSAHAAPKPAATGSKLPLHYTTGSATRVITVVARSHGSTTAKLQAWSKVSGGWRKYGSAVTAHVGAQGLTTHTSESKSATPIGSFTLTQAFGRRSDPGTALPYFKTRPSDWWISQSGRLYNTHQRCSSGCSFTRGDPNEHLYYETPYYNYAVVIDANTRNAPGGVHQGKGSAFFLHVTDGHPTAGCVAISQSKLVSLMRWLRPSAHPRMLIGVT
jgi:L,D-peptidoglycan transpeptidase YkuD (ErfK/YbiS/YcfS/YnhG family)